MTYILTNQAFGEKTTQFDRDLPIWVFEVFFSNELKTCLPCSHDDDGTESDNDDIMVKCL